MNPGRPVIVIRDIHHYGDDLTVPDAVARFRDGGQVTVTVTDPAPPGGEPRGNPRHGYDITVRPTLGGQPGRPRRSPGKPAPSKPPATPPCSPRPCPLPAGSPPAPPGLTLPGREDSPARRTPGMR